MPSTYRLRDATPDLKAARSAFNVRGKAFKDESYVDITWVWISFLAIELLLATILLLLTILTQFRERRRHAKDDTATPMFHDYKDGRLIT